MKVYSIARTQLAGSAVLFAAAGLYVWDVLGRHGHLADSNYAWKLAGFSGLLGLVAYAIFACAVCRWHRPTWVALIAAVLVFVPARLLNERQPRVLIIAIEGLRADRVAVTGGQANTTPNLQDWFDNERSNVRFHTASSHSGSHEAAITALTTGKPLASDAPWLDKLFPGHLTRVAVTHGTDPARAFLAAEEIELFSEAAPEVQVARFRNWFRAAPSESISVFDFGSMKPVGRPEARFDVFVPDGADPPSAFADFGERETIDPIDYLHAIQHYDGSVLQMDAFLGRTLKEMERLGELDDTLVVLTGSTGFAYREHGSYGTLGRPFEELVHVPLLMRLPSPTRMPALLPTVRSIEGPVQHADVITTIAGFLHSRMDTDGRDLCKTIYLAEPLEERGIPLASVSEFGPVLGVRLEDWKMFLVPDEDGELEEEVWRLRPPNREEFSKSVEPESRLRLQRELARWFGEPSTTEVVEVSKEER